MKSNITKTGVIFHLFPVMLISSITIFTSYLWGRYVILGCMMFILISDVVKTGKIHVSIKGIFLNILALAIYSSISALWALNFRSAIINAKTLFEMIIMLLILYNHYFADEDGVKNFLIDIKLASFVVVMYAISFYGIDTLIQMAELERRLYKSFANVNTIGMISAIGVLIQVDEIIGVRKFKVLGLFCIPSIILIALTQSRKALVILLLGFFLILCFRNIYSQNVLNVFGRCLAISLIVIILFVGLIKIPIFNGLMGRMNGLINVLSQSNDIDASTNVRNIMVKIGWDQFLKTPLFGIGMGNSHVLTERYFSESSYLHNNFIELIACGGIIGFTIYYAMYVYLFRSYWNFKQYKNREYYICLTIMIVMLLMDWGRVSYLAKTQYIYLLLYFLEAIQIKKISLYNNGGEDANKK